MAFGNIAAFYFPIAANAGASQWGTDVRKLLSSADATGDATTVTDHGTGGAVTRTEDPYTTSTTDGTEANFGWAITPADMNSLAGARRFFAAGDHVATVPMTTSGVGATGTLTMSVYRVGPAAARTRTLLGSNSASVVLSGLGAVNSATVTVALAEVIFDADETVQYSFEFNVAGVIVVGRTVVFYTGTQSSVVARLDTPTLRVLADTTGTATGSGTATGVTGKVLGTIGTAAGTSTVAGAMSSRADTTGTAAGTSTATGVAGATGATTGTAAGTSAVTGVAGARGSTTGTAAGTSTVTGVAGATGATTGTAAGTSTVAGAMSSRADTTGTAAGTSTATGLASSLSGTVGTAAGTSTVSGRTSIVLGTIGTVDVGGACPSDFVGTDPSKQIAGVVYDSAGAPAAGAAVKLFRQSDDLQVATTVSGGDGSYAFVRDAADPNSYYVLAYSDAAHHGTTDRGLVAV